ncbi:hypothetical protein [Actinomyces oris]|uniref:hypothetical protein n=1 Tax=Actinomyces oris TaxID=544580 RepID=UPI003D16C51F
MRADGSTIRSIMRDLGLQAAGPRAKVRTTVPAQDLDERPGPAPAGLPPLTSPARSCAGTFPRKREVPPPTSGRGPDSSIWRPFWTAVLRRSWVMRWATTCTRPGVPGH